MRQQQCHLKDYNTFLLVSSLQCLLAQQFLMARQHLHNNHKSLLLANATGAITNKTTLLKPENTAANSIALDAKMLQLTGFALKKILKWMIIIVGFLAGMFFVGVQLLQKYGYVSTVNWD
jgi:hypothetical protein